MKVKYKGKGLERAMLQWMPPWASDVTIEDQLKVLPIHWQI
jgi:hypothetical protein